MTDNTTPYCQAARFSSKTAAGAVYTPLQELVLAEEIICDLSVYRFKITPDWHVVVLGDTRLMHCINGLKLYYPRERFSIRKLRGL
jgi:hypothetical protein